MTVLIVEDNASVRRLMRSIVARVAHEIYECEDGADAVAAYLEYRPDFVLMDIEMKDLDGIAATKQIKAAHPAAKIIMVTNYDDTELRDAARTAGACGYVLKHSLLEVNGVLRALTQQ
jgi:two-component system chemotaxis response regulator CheY